MKFTKLMLSLAATAMLLLAPWSTPRAAAQSKHVQVNPLIAQFGHESRAMTPSSNAAVVTESGPVKGFQFAGDEQAANNVEVFLGIPYAAPPIGDLRWMPPQPPAKFDGVFRANSFGNFCTQPDGRGGTIGSEDCLTLNIIGPLARKNQNQNSLLPVMVWIHGGGLVTGGSFFYDPSPIVLAGNVIVVTINYRLGFLGFFAHSAIDGEGHLNGNYGFMDQQEALRWVQRNIRSFGGDPSQVTIFGESAGGQSVYSNLASPTASGLFRSAIAESGAYVEFQDYFNFIVPLAVGETPGTGLVQSGEAIANSVGCANQTADCLRGAAASAFALQEPGTIYPFVDGTVLTQTPTAAFASGQFNQVPVMTGGNHDEWRAFIDPAITDAQYPGAVASLEGSTVADPFVQFLVNVVYPLTNYPPFDGVESAFPALGALGTDQIFACPERNSVQLLSQFVTTYAYEFNDEDAPPGEPFGAYHTAELQYLFDFNRRFHGFNPFTPAQQQLSDDMIRYWTNFATTGDPNSATIPVWSPYSIVTDEFQSLVPGTPAPEASFTTDHKCGLWDSF